MAKRDELLAELEQRRAVLREASIDVTAVESGSGRCATDGLERVEEVFGPLQITPRSVPTASVSVPSPG